MNKVDRLKGIIKDCLNGKMTVNTIERVAEIIANKLIQKGVSVPDELQ